MRREMKKYKCFHCKVQFYPTNGARFLMRILSNKEKDLEFCSAICIHTYMTILQHLEKYPVGTCVQRLKFEANKKVA